MDKTVSPAKSSLNFGILFGIIMILEFVISYVADLDPQKNRSVGIITSVMNYMVLPVIFIVLGSLSYKKNHNGGYISFSEVLKIGISITVLAALLFSLFNAGFNYVFPEFVEKSMSQIREVMLEQNPNMTEDQVENALMMTKKFMNPLISIPLTIAMYAFFGLLWSLIVGAFVKNDKPSGY